MCLLVAYDGHHYHGWQRQLNDASVQVTLEKAITEMNGAYAKVRGASRTDAGVHALGQAAAFDASRSIPMNGWKYGLNQLLPRDIAVIDARACELGYNPRYRARSKVYRYLVLDSDTRIPWWADRAWYLGSYYKSTRRTELNADAMQQALGKYQKLTIIVCSRFNQTFNLVFKLFVRFDGPNKILKGCYSDTFHGSTCSLYEELNRPLLFCTTRWFGRRGKGALMRALNSQHLP